MPGVIAQVLRLKQEGAERGLTDCFVAFLPKPQVYIDDQPLSEWALCTHLYPTQADHV